MDIRKKILLESFVKHWNRLLRGVVELLSLQAFRCVDVTLGEGGGTWFRCGCGSVRFMVELDHLKGIFKLK